MRLLFGDFDRNSHKDLIFINKEGKIIKYHFNKKKNGKISPILSVQWILVYFNFNIFYFIFVIN